MNPEGLNLVFPHAYVPAAMYVSLLSMWMLVGLFVYLNRYTKREYFTIWTAAWLFYALWLTLNLQTSGSMNAATTATTTVASALAHAPPPEYVMGTIFILK